MHMHTVAYAGILTCTYMESFMHTDKLILDQPHLMPT